MNVRLCAGAAMMVLLGAEAAQAQQSRGELIRLARNESADTVALQYYLQAAQPVGIDSLWAVSVYEIAQIYRDRDQNGVAATWIRWADRHGSWPIDAYFSPSLRSFYDSVASASAVGLQRGDSLAGTRWIWPPTLSMSADGRLRLDALDAATPLTVSVLGHGDVADEGVISLPPGTYQLVAAAPGYDSVSVRREVLPGVETVVTFELLPAFSSEAGRRVEGSLLSIRVPDATGATCRNGVWWGDGYILSALSGLAGNEEVEVLAREAEARRARVVGTDAAADLAVLSVDGAAGPALRIGRLAGQSYGWSVYREACDGPSGIQRARVSEPYDALTLPQATLGAPVVDRDGALLGLVVANHRFSPIDRVDQLVDEAAVQLEQGGFPFMWTAVGVAVAGGVAAFMLRESAPPGGETGTIIVRIPG